MTSPKEIDEALSSHDLPLELRRAWTVHRSEEPKRSRMVCGIVGLHEQDDVISPYLVRQNLVVPAFPYRAASSPAPRRTNH